jgi:hypothetical protein
MSCVWQLRDGSTKLDFDAPRADQFAMTGRWVKNEQFLWREFVFAVIATDGFGHLVRLTPIVLMFVPSPSTASRFDARYPNPF